MTLMQELTGFITERVLQSTGNRVDAAWALKPEDIGMQLYAEPLIAAADAADPLFERMKEPDAVGPWYRGPEEWVPGARSVISIFYPFTDAVKQGNIAAGAEIGAGWLYGRIEGQAFLLDMSRAITAFLKERGYAAAAPQLEEAYRGWTGYSTDADGEHSFTSNWSERHTAFIAGLGTFGLAKNLITAKGCAGRFGSVITDAPLPVTQRPYTGIYEYCSGCGACMRRCPADAIRPDGSKDKAACSAYVQQLSREKYAPRFGCGKCQVAVPCMNGIPPRPAKKP